MSLWFTLRLNTKEIGSLVVRRITQTDRAVLDDDEVSTYIVVRDGHEMGKVTHRYGDGAWVLVRKALDLYVVAPGEGGA
jgi:hypothetical protein